MLVFDFLGVEEPFGEPSPLKDIFVESGFEMQVIDVFPWVIRKGEATEQSLVHINKHYPSYIFRQEGDNLVHDILIVKAILNNSVK